MVKSTPNTQNEDGSRNPEIDGTLVFSKYGSPHAYSQFIEAEVINLEPCPIS